MVPLVHDFEDGMQILIGACSVWSGVRGGVHGGFGQTLRGWRVSGWVVGGMHKDGCMKIHPMYVELS